MTLGRVYMNFESRAGYLRIFRRFFDLIAQSTGQLNQWGTIHNSGWQAIVVDMDTKQYPGKATYKLDINWLLTSF